jgi:hypothetical protein
MMLATAKYPWYQGLYASTSGYEMQQTSSSYLAAWYDSSSWYVILHFVMNCC